MEWISVKDRLPLGYYVADEYTNTLELEEYIVHVEGAELATIGYFDVGQNKFVKSLYFNAEEFYGEVDYWMPLPEPPKTV